MLTSARENAPRTNAAYGRNSPPRHNHLRPNQYAGVRRTPEHRMERSLNEWRSKDSARCSIRTTKNSQRDTSTRWPNNNATTTHGTTLFRRGRRRQMAPRRLQQCNRKIHELQEGRLLVTDQMHGRPAFARTLAGNVKKASRSTRPFCCIKRNGKSKILLLFPLGVDRRSTHARAISVRPCTSRTSGHGKGKGQRKSGLLQSVERTKLLQRTSGQTSHGCPQQ